MLERSAADNYINRSQFQKSSKILEIHRCDLKAGRFRWLFIQQPRSNYRFDLINADFLISF